MAQSHRNRNANYTAQYTMNTREIQLFTELLTSKEERFRYSAFILILLKECNFDILKVLRILTAMMREPRVTNINITANVFRIIKTAVIFAELENGKTINDMAKLNRFQLLSITKDFIYRTRHKYLKRWNKTLKTLTECKQNTRNT